MAVPREGIFLRPLLASLFIGFALQLGLFLVPPVMKRAKLLKMLSLFLMFPFISLVIFEMIRVLIANQVSNFIEWLIPGTMLFAYGISIFILFFPDVILNRTGSYLINDRAKFEI